MSVATLCLRGRSLYMLTFTVNICGEDDMKYTIKTGLSSRVSFLNPSWNEDVDSAGVNDRFKVCIRPLWVQRLFSCSCRGPRGPWGFWAL